MDYSELQEELQELIPSARIETNRQGQIVIFTGLRIGDGDELIELDDDDEDVDLVFDSDTVSLEDEDSDD